jgi:hypothetical protein
MQYRDRWHQPQSSRAISAKIATKVAAKTKLDESIVALRRFGSIFVHMDLI